MNWPGYPNYQDTGTGWLGQIPAGWDLRPLGHFFRERKTTVSDRDFQPLSVTKHGIVPQLDTAAKTDNGDNRKLVRAGDFVINSRSDRKGSAGLSPLDGSVSVISTVLEPRGLLGGYVHHLLRSQAFQEEYYRFGSGIVADLWSTRYSAMKMISLPVPPGPEQAAIADFVDAETDKIDVLIGRQEQLIATLREDRAATITHAVTKGIDPDVELWSSGVDWLGAIPSHWTVIALKRALSQPITDGPHETPEFLDDGVEFISAEAVSTGVIDFERKRGFISRESNARYSMKYSPRLHDIYIVKSGATTGVSAIVTENREFNIWSPLAALRCGEGIEPYFLLNFIRSRNFQDAVALNWSYGTQQNIGMGVLGDLRVALPPLSEQRRIVRYIQTLEGPLADLVEKASAVIDTLREYKSALITDAVTGKIDVRRAV